MKNISILQYPSRSSKVNLYQSGNFS